jgi:hypothetical protein
MAKDVFSRLPHFHNLSTNQQATLLAVVHRCDSIYKLPRGEANSIAREIGATGQTVRNYARMIRLIVQLYQTKPLDLTSWLEDNAANSTEKRFLQCLYSPQYSWADLQAQPEDSEDKAVCGDVALQVAALERRLANTKAAFAQLNGDYDELKEEYDKATAALIKAQQIIRRISTEIDDGAPDDLYDYTPPIQGKTRPSNQFAEQEDLPKKVSLGQYGALFASTEYTRLFQREWQRLCLTAQEDARKAIHELAIKGRENSAGSQKHRKLHGARRDTFSGGKQFYLSRAGSDNYRYAWRQEKQHIDDAPEWVVVMLSIGPHNQYY